MKRTRFYGPAAIALLVLLAGCITTGNNAVNPSPSASAGSGEERRLPEVKDYGRIIDPADPELRDLWDTAPRQGRPVFLVFSNRLQDRDDEWVWCLHKAAQQVSLHRSFRGVAWFYMEKLGNRFGWMGEFEHSYEGKEAVPGDPRLQPYFDQLEVIDRYRDTRGSYMLVAWDGGGRLSLPRISAQSGARPSWVDEPPRIPGYLTAVGTAQRKSLVTDSITAADEAAMAGIVKELSIEVITKDYNLSIESMGSVSGEKRTEVAKAEVKGFYILARWKEGNNFYSLALAPESNRVINQD